MTRTDWPVRWMHRARDLAEWSKDPSTKVGCVLVREQHSISEGYNGFPHGADDSPDTYANRPLKYERTVHAEVNAVAHAARFGVAVAGSIAFVTFPICPPCAGVLIQAGVVAVHVALPKSCRWCDIERGGRPPGKAHMEVTERFSKGSLYFHTARSRAGPYLVSCDAPSNPEWVARYDISKTLFQEAGVPVVEHVR